MSILTLSIDADLEKFIDSQVQSKKTGNKSAFVRDALHFFREELEVREILQASQDVTDGKIFKGDLRELAKKFK
jgi:Arc/MetJ-type ribon-helix-helix transcriptional regulator